MQATIEIMPVGTQMMTLHHELGKAEIEGHQVRFCQHINGSLFWLTVDREVYVVKTEDFMNSILNAVMEKRNEVPRV